MLESLRDQEVSTNDIKEIIDCARYARVIRIHKRGIRSYHESRED